jgi:hypothetical protein
VSALSPFSNLKLRLSRYLKKQEEASSIPNTLEKRAIWAKEMLNGHSILLVVVRPSHRSKQEWVRGDNFFLEESSVKWSILTTFVATKAQKRRNLDLTISLELFQLALSLFFADFGSFLLILRLQGKLC